MDYRPDFNLKAKFLYLSFKCHVKGQMTSFTATQRALWHLLVFLERAKLVFFFFLYFHLWANPLKFLLPYHEVASLVSGLK